MHKLPTATYLNSEEIGERARLIELEAILLPPGNAKSALVEEARKLRGYADMKRLLMPSRA